MNPIIGQAIPADWPGIQTLLSSVDLPRDGLCEHLGTTFLARTDGEVVGCAALELYGEFALLRSVAVGKAFQGQGLGHDLTRAALDLARKSSIREVYLLTDTAGKFFPRFGFKPTVRSDVPEAIQASIEFTDVCPKSSLVMVLRLKQEPAS